MRCRACENIYEVNETNDDVHLCPNCVSSLIPYVVAVGRKIVSEGKFHKWGKTTWKKAETFSTLKVELPSHAIELEAKTDYTSGQALDEFLDTGKVIDCKCCGQKGNTVMVLMKRGVDLICEDCVIAASKGFGSEIESRYWNIHQANRYVDT